jgi:hypothetical protein
MSRTDIQNFKFEHIIDSPAYRFVCVNVGGRTRNLRIYSDGMVESYEGGRFVQLPSELAKAIRLTLGRTQNIPTFQLHNGTGLPATC